ncbi:MAG: DUF4412 domain-containing protein [Ignavibacteriales bacterium]|nr:DUF4412 domain-containing protein [Ignavibacteriales bacterium]
MFQRIYKLIIFSVLMLTGMTQISVAQFEGAIDMKVTMIEEGKPQVMEYSMFVKKDLIASQIKSTGADAMQGKFIFRGDKKVLWILNDAEKNYLEMPTKEFNKPETGKNENKKSPKPKVTKTGKSEKILGYVCEEVIIDEGKEVTHIWGTGKLGNFYGDLMKSFGCMSENAKAELGWEAELEALKLFPLKIVSKENGNITQTQEVTKIEAKSIPQKTFDVPSGYTKVPMNFNLQEMMSEPNKDDPGSNIEMEKMMKQLQEMQEGKEDSSDGG